MSDRARNPRLPQADGTAVWKAPQWGEQAPAQVVFPGHGRPIDPEQREAELTRFVGRMTADGWTEVHRMPGAVLLAQVQPAHGATAVGVGATGVAAGAAVGGVGLLGVLGGIGMIILGVLLTLTIIGAIIGIPMILSLIHKETATTAHCASRPGPMRQDASSPRAPEHRFCAACREEGPATPPRPSPGTPAVS